ncbi:hypothetical protein DFJ74DRAFT_388316 [Hyaloraphidium curvatum]|nr:hypothetical protein DFJ74DRAFT_388316 [Hyaloraphidium curvatum]
MWKPAREIQAISSSSALDLKAEVVKEKQQFQKEKAAQSSVGPVVSGKKFQRPKPPPPPANRGVEERSRRDLEDVAVTPTVEQSWVALQRKAELYEQLKRDGGLDLTEKKEEEVLVDFVRKAFEAKVEDGGEARGRAKSDLGADADPWVEYVDEFGRTRIARKSQLPDMPPPPRQALANGFVKAGSTAKTSDETSLLSKDMLVEQERLEWERNAREEVGNDGTPAHYDSKREVRNLGVGFYQLSQDEAERQEQLGKLKELRTQTTAARTTELARKNKRKERLEARRKLIVAKAKRRKGEDAGSGDEDNQDVQDVAVDEPEAAPSEDKLKLVDEFLQSVRHQVERSSGASRKAALFGDLLDDT